MSEAPFLLPLAPESTNHAASCRAPDTRLAANQRDTRQLDFRMSSPEVPASRVGKAVGSYSRTFYTHGGEVP